MTTHEHRQPTHREDLERTLVGGIACFIGEDPAKAKAIADGIKTLLDGLAPAMPQPASIAALPVIDPGPDSLEQEIQAKGKTAPRVTPADIEDAIICEDVFTAVDGLLGKYKTVGLSADSPLHNVTICVLVLADRSTVSGVSHGLHGDEAAAKARELAIASAVQRFSNL